MTTWGDQRANFITWLLILLPPLVLLAPALRPGYTLLPAQLPYVVDPLWQPLAPPNTTETANPVLSDQFYQYHAWQTSHRQTLAQGELAWWTPDVNGGQPLLGNGQVGLLDPFNLVGLLFPLAASYVVGALLRLWIAATFTYLYGRTIGLSRVAAWLAMLAFALSGPVVCWLGATPSHVLVWLPALLWTGERWMTSRHIKWALAVVIILALMLVSSQPEIAFQVGVAWASYLLVRAAWVQGGLLAGVRAYAPRWVVIALLGLALAAVEVLPFLDAARQSVVLTHRINAQPTSFLAWLQGALLTWQQWPTLITALLPNFLGREQDESYWYPVGNSIENNAYAGVLPLVLALLALWAAWRGHAHAQRRWLWLWGALGTGSLALALEAPLFAALNDLPPFSLVAPGRWRGVYVFAVAILAGFGLDLLLAERALRRPFLILLASAAATNAVLVTVAYTGFSLYAAQLIASGRAFMQANVGSPMLDRPLEELYALVEVRQQAKLAMLHPSNPVMFLPVWVALVVAIIWWLHRRASFPAATILTAITWLDLLWVGAGINSAAPTTLLDRIPPAVEFLQSQPTPFRVVGTHLILNPNMSMLAQLEDVRGYDPLMSSRYRSLLSGLDGFAPSGYHNYFIHLDDPRLDRFNAVYGLSRTAPTDARWQAVYEDPSGVTVYRSASALPRAYLVYTAEVVESAEESLARTLDLAFDARQGVILEQEPQGFTSPAAPPDEPGQVEFRNRRAKALEMAVTTPAPAILVLLETYDPGWQAAIDQQPVPLYVANHAFRAVVVPAGSHTVTFTYRPPSLWLGMSISAGALIIVLGIGVWQRIGVQRRKHKNKEIHGEPYL